jgi:hypothetical protein
MEVRMFDNDNFERIMIARAKEGALDENGMPDDARCCLKAIVTAIYNKNIDSPYFAYLADCLELYLQGIPIERALGLEGELKGGRPIKYDGLEVSSIDLLLREHAFFKKEEANVWIEENLGMDRRSVQKIRGEYCSRYNKKTDPDLSESRRRDYLLHDLSQPMREKVAMVLPHIK